MVYMRGGKLRIAGRTDPVRIQPRMKLHVPFMALLNKESHHVKIPFRGNALLSGIKAAPRLQLRTVESIGLRPHLENNGIDAAIFQEIELADKATPHFRRGHLLVFPLEGRLYPCSPELPLGVFRQRFTLWHLYGLARGDTSHPQHEQAFCYAYSYIFHSHSVF